MEALDRDVLFAVAEKLVYSPNFDFNNHFSNSKLVDFMLINKVCTDSVYSEFAKMKTVSVVNRPDNELRASFSRNKEHELFAYEFCFSGPFYVDVSFLRHLIRNGKFNPKCITLTHILSYKPVEFMERLCSTEFTSFTCIEYFNQLLFEREESLKINTSLELLDVCEEELIDPRLLFPLNAETMEFTLRIRGYNCFSLNPELNINKVIASNVKRVKLNLRSSFAGNESVDGTCLNVSEWDTFVEFVGRSCLNLEILIIRLDFEDDYRDQGEFLLRRIQTARAAIVDHVLLMMRQKIGATTSISIELRGFLYPIDLEELATMDSDLSKLGECRPTDDMDIIRCLRYDDHCKVVCSFVESTDYEYEEQQHDVLADIMGYSDQEDHEYDYDYDDQYYDENDYDDVY